MNYTEFENVNAILLAEEIKNLPRCILAVENKLITLKQQRRKIKRTILQSKIVSKFVPNCLMNQSIVIIKQNKSLGIDVATQMDITMQSKSTQSSQTIQCINAYSQTDYFNCASNTASTVLVDKGNLLSAKVLFVSTKGRENYHLLPNWKAPKSFSLITIALNRTKVRRIRIAAEILFQQKLC
jgi:hypothetical protein